MKMQFVYIIPFLLLTGCANNASKETDIETTMVSEIFDENTSISEKDAYTGLITKKLQERIDKKTLAKTHPDFNIEVNQNELFSGDEIVIKKVEFIEPFVIISDSVKTVKTKVIFESKTDTLITHIKTAETEIDGEMLKIIKISFTTVEKPKTLPIKSSVAKEPIHAERFSIQDLSFTWEEINACDCLYMAKIKNTSYQKLYFGRFKGDSSGILQLGKNTEKQLIPLSRPRSKNRKYGSSWRETYENKHYKIQLKATATKPKVQGKYTYFINFSLLELSSKKLFKTIVLTNCKS